MTSRYQRNKTHFVIPLVNYPSASSWTNQPAALTEIFGNSRLRTAHDLRDVNEYRIICVVSTGGLAGANMNMQYSVNDGAAWADLAAADAGEIAIDTTGLIVGAWATIVAAARVENVWLRMIGEDGDGAADPGFGQISVEFRT